MAGACGATDWIRAAAGAGTGSRRSHATNQTNCVASPAATPVGEESSHGDAANAIETGVTKLNIPAVGLRCILSTTNPI
jgi:hypothetical protein